MNLRKAKPSESDLLNVFAFESESIWGEDESYMTLFSQEYKVTENMIENEHVYILENNKIIVGFFAIIKRKELSELELFYVNRSLLGKGYGSLLWSHMIKICKDNSIEKIELIASLDVADFYKKIGAKEVEKIQSTLKVGRIVSRFEYKIL